jgi:hypothetical protein
MCRARPTASTASFVETDLVKGAAAPSGWRFQHEAWVVQHTSVREAVHELKSQTAKLAEILELLRSRTR